MTKGTKRVLFYSAVAVFLILSYVVILYAQGYKYSFSENKFFKTGAVYLKVNTDANIYLDDKFLGNTSFFGSSYRIEGLLPDQYTLKVQRDDYSSWQKLITVDEGFVSEFSKILILPKDESGLAELEKEIASVFPTPTPSPTAPPTQAAGRATPSSPTKTTASSSPTPTPTQTVEPFVTKKGVLSDTGENPEIIASNVKGFMLSKDKNKLAWWTTTEVWVMWLNDTNYQPYHKKGDKELVTKFSTQIKKAAWFRDEDHLIVDSISTSSRDSVPRGSPQVDSNGYKVLEIDTRGGVNVIEL